MRLIQSKINSSLNKIKSNYRKIKTGIQVTLHPENFYLYSKDIYLDHQLSFSQEGEDMILSRFFNGKTEGFYIDVGAHHPQRFSNTYGFYLNGWTGINIDAMPGSMKLFNELRPNDINLEVAISEQEQTLTYYQFNEPALNSLSIDVSRKHDGVQGFKIINSVILETCPLSYILDKYLPINKPIDFLSVDVEGLDLQVLKSNNWEKYRPAVVLAEAINIGSISEAYKCEVGMFMQMQRYDLYAKSVNTLIFAENS